MKQTKQHRLKNHGKDDPGFGPPEHFFKIAQEKAPEQDLLPKSGSDPGDRRHGIDKSEFIAPDHH